MTHPYESIETFLLENPPRGDWSVRNAGVLYMSPNRRIRIVLETQSDTSDLHRHEVLEQAGVSTYELDETAFAQQFFALIGDEFSIHSLGVFIEVLQRELDAWEAERLARLQGT